MAKEKNVDWKDTEKITAILEKFITPDSKVEHNIFLPVIGRPERKPRQCDVVIKFGVPPRQSTTIVEVQKRNKKPDINTFHGWYQKMVEVGAQQLICVSKLGYPKSIINEVKNKYGSTVTLMTLEEFDFLKNPEKVNILPYNIILQPTFDFLEIGRMMLAKKLDKETMALNTIDKCFSIGEHPELYAINEIVGQWLHKQYDVIKLNELHEKKNKLIIDYFIEKEANIFFHYNTEKFLISQWSLKIDMDVTKTIQPTTVKHYKYRQEFLDGSIAWIATTQVVINGIEKKIDIIFKSNAGFIEIKHILH